MNIRLLLIRICRKVINKLNYYEINDPNINGEYFFLERAIHKQRNIILLDVGGYNGDWANFACERFKKNIRYIFVFEPFTFAFKRIEDRFRNNNHIKVFNKALTSNDRKKAKLYYSDAYGGNSSLLKIDNNKNLLVDTFTIDKLIVKQKIKTISYVKVDTEGHDYSVIIGSLNSLISNKIDFLQFEYNWRWIIQNNTLKDIFKLLKENKLEYKIGRITKNKILIFSEWHPGMESYIESNFILISNRIKTLDKFIKKVKFNKYNILV